MALTSAEQAHVDSILAAAATIMAAKAEGEKYVSDRLGLRLTLDIEAAVRDAAGAEDWSDLATYNA